MLKYLIFFGLLVLAKSKDPCRYEIDHIQDLVDRGQQFRHKYNYGMINRDENDHKISESFKLKCNATDCYISFHVSNSSVFDTIDGHFKVGEDQLYRGWYARGRTNWRPGYLEHCQFEVMAENGFNITLYDSRKDHQPKTEIILPTNNLNDNIENLVSLAGQNSEKQEYLGDLFQAHRNAFNFLKNLSKEDRAVNFRSNYFFKNDKESESQWDKVYSFELLDNRDDEVFVRTHKDGGQTGVYICNMRQNQEFNITSGAVVLSGERYYKFSYGL